MILAAPATPSADRRQLTSTSRACSHRIVVSYFGVSTTGLKTAHGFETTSGRTILSTWRRRAPLSRCLPEAVLRILRYLVGNYWGRYLGWPDLLVYKKDDFFFAEIKASKDKLSAEQKRWIVDPAVLGRNYRSGDSAAASRRGPEYTNRSEWRDPATLGGIGRDCRSGNGFAASGRRRWSSGVPTKERPPVPFRLRQGQRENQGDRCLLEAQPSAV